MDGAADVTAERREWLGLMAQALPGRVVALSEGLTAEFAWLRRPEIGTVMVRGRTAGTGAPFNLGEITVTRASVQLEVGPVGHGYVQGREKKAAERAALVDALMQTEQAGAVRAQVIAPLAVEAAEAARSRAAKAAATKVEFFTLVRGEDQ
ncbi:MAG: phosphonate C-P lyase system protein PhnG [Rhodobacterales bacterium]|jgi:alpha-D-ribose 1-methylphosphonate 5-triphosphate synthase subunit PhnG|nr:phosphonate C-P lyase system protein PhnG [Rhodobacterales bacterium]